MRKNKYSRNENGIEEDKQRESDIMGQKQKEDEEQKKEAYDMKKRKRNG